MGTGPTCGDLDFKVHVYAENMVNPILLNKQRNISLNPMQTIVLDVDHQITHVLAKWQFFGIPSKNGLICHC